MVLPISDRISRVPPYSRTSKSSTRTGLSPAMARLSRRFRFSLQRHWPGPRSLATTCGVSVDVLSSGYLDVSVPRVRRANLCIQSTLTLRWGFPIRKFPDQSLLAAPRDLSQRATSFIASQCQGIHQMPFLRLFAQRHARRSDQRSCSTRITDRSGHSRKDTPRIGHNPIRQCLLLSLHNVKQPTDNRRNNSAPKGCTAESRVRIHPPACHPTENWWR